MCIVFEILDIFSILLIMNDFYWKWGQISLISELSYMCVYEKPQESPHRPNKGIDVAMAWKNRLQKHIPNPDEIWEKFRDFTNWDNATLSVSFDQTITQTVHFTIPKILMSSSRKT